MRRVLKTTVLGLSLMAGPVLADGQSNLERSVARELPLYVKGVDVSSLRHSQVAALHLIITGEGSEAYKLRRIKSVLGGPNSLRGLLFGTS